MRTQRLLLLLTVCLPAALAQSGALIYIATWPRTICVIDEAQAKVVGQIPLHIGPARGLLLSFDKKRIYVNTMRDNGIEVVDLGTRQVTNYFALDGGGRQMRINGLADEPQGRFLYAVVEPIIKQVDRYELERLKLAVVDLAQRKITKVVDFPKEEAESAYSLGTDNARWGGYRVSPDGKFLYAFQSDKVLVFDTNDLKLVEKIELSKLPNAYLERISLDRGGELAVEPGAVTVLFHASDPIVRRPLFGIARFDLTSRTFNFTPLGVAATPVMGFLLTPDSKTAYALSYNSGGIQYDRANRRYEFLAFDVKSRRLTRRLDVPARTRFYFGISSTGKELYVYYAGPTLEIYDAETFKLREVLDLNADMTTGMVVVRSTGS